MRLLLMGSLALGLVVVTGAAHAEQPAPAAATAPGTPRAAATPPAATAGPAEATATAAPALGELRAPQNVHAEPSTPASVALSGRSATAEMKGNPEDSLKLAEQAIRANPRDPWPHYDKGMALARVGELTGALAALLTAEQHFAPGDRWGRSVAVFGRAHILGEAG